MQRILAALALTTVLCCALAAQACNVPVFRYALERWHPDPYRATLFHRGPLTAEQRSAVDPLEVMFDKGTGNLALRIVDVDDLKDEADRALFAAQKSPQLPWLAVRYPQSLRSEQTVWSGPLADKSAAGLLASPLRTELIRRLADGQTAVWLMLECGDATKDAAVAAQLETELKQLSQKLELPELSSAPEDNLLSNAPLKVAFSLMRVPRGAAEQALVDLLLHSEPDLVEFAEPMVFPVFGRGRALLPLIGAGITSDNIHESASFLVGACSCEIKELNPGFDLLLAADWDVLLFKEGPPPEIIATRKAVAAGKPELVTIAAGAEPAPPAATTDSPASSSLPTVTMPATAPNSAPSLVLVGLLLAIVVVALKRFVFSAATGGFWWRYWGVAMLLEIAFWAVYAWQLGRFNMLLAAPPPGVATVIRADELLVNSQGDAYSPTDHQKQVTLFLELQGVSAKEMSGIRSIFVEAGGVRHPSLWTQYQGGNPDKVRLVFIVPRASQEMTLYLGQHAPISFQSSTDIVPQWALPDDNEPVSIIVAGVLTYFFPVLAVVGAVGVGTSRLVRRRRAA